MQNKIEYTSKKIWKKPMQKTISNLELNKLITVSACSSFADTPCIRRFAR